MADTKLAKVGITVKESWKNDISYEVLDYTLWRVQDGGDGCGYIAKRANIGVVPNSDDSVWIKATQAGQSIYDLAVKYGHFVGTEEEFEAEYQAALQAARDAASETSATNAEIQEAEELRRASEDERADAETARQESEIAREATESDRQIAENMRQMAETQRGENETTRQSQETARESSETQRQSNESTRQSNETARESAEQERTADFEALKTDMETAIGEADAATAAAVALNNQVAGDESARQQAEQSRVAAETQRQTAETQRGTNEQTRQTQETARQTAESTRNTQETARQTAEGQRATAEEGRASAESGRVSAETARQTAETAREGQSTSDHQRAEDDHAIAEEDHATLDEKISHKADIDGSYDGMAVGIARNLEGRTDVTDSFFKRTTGGDAEVANGTAQLNEVKGKSQVWNQLVRNADIFTANQVAKTSYANGKYTLTTTSGNTSTYWQLFCYQFNFVTSHKYFVSTKLGYNGTGVSALSAYYVIANVGTNREKVDISSGDTTYYKRIVTVVTDDAEQLKRFSIYGNKGNGVVGDVYTVEDINIIDLTLIFGVGNEPSTVEEFEAWLAENIGEQAYYPYNAGEVLNNRMTGVESIGFNLLDPATGKADIIGAYSDVYGNYYGITGTHGTLTFTDKFGNTETITPDEDGKFLLEKAGTLSVADAGEDCAVFLWWDGTQTEFKQYEKNVGALDVTHIYGKLNGEGEYVRVWPTGMPGIGDIKDSLKVVDGQNVAERKVGEVDMGTMAWEKDSVAATKWIVRNCGFIKQQSGYAKPNMLCVPYKTRDLNGFNAATDGVITIPPQGISANISVKDAGTYADAAAFAAHLSGTILYYEMATPQVYTDLIYRNHESFADGTPVTLPMNYKVDNWGIERIAPQNTEETVVTTKPELTMRYSIDAVEELNTHRDEIDDLYEKNEELDQRKPEKYGEYPDMAVGSAKNIAGDLATDAEFKFRKTGGNDAVASGLAKLTAVYGKSLVWNQLFDKAKITSRTFVGVQITNNGDGSVKFEGVCTSSYADYVPFIEPASTNPNHPYNNQTHKYLLYGFGTMKVTTYNTRLGNGIHTGSELSQNGGYPQIVLVKNEEYNETIWPKLIDLTLMFGAGNEPETVAEFEAMFPLPYYGYNEGEIISNKAEAIETVGFNQWDEEWEGGTINLSNGTNTASNNCIRSKNYIGVIGGATYNIKCPAGPSRKCYYDANKNFISSENTAEGAFTTPSNAAYVRFATYSSYGNTYKNDICINLSDPSRNGEYEPYRKYTLPLNIPTLTGKLNGEGESVVVCPEGLKSAGSVRDELVIKNGYATSVIKRVGILDLGTLTYIKDASYGYYCVANSLSLGLNIKFPANNSTLGNALAISLVLNTYTSMKAKGVGSGEFAISTNAICVSSSLEDAATFKSAMDGVLLYYELDTPEEYILDEPFYVGYQEDANGTEKRLPDDTAESVMPAFPCKIAYPIDVVKTINELGNTYVPRVEYAKYGVISQGHSWVTDPNGTGQIHTIVNIVRGYIPITSIDLFVTCGAVFNEQTGYFELNGLTDISYKEMLNIYEWGRAELPLTRYKYCNHKIRTTIPQDDSYFNYVTASDFSAGFLYTDIEVIRMTKSNNSGRRGSPTVNGTQASFSCHRMSDGGTWAITQNSGTITIDAKNLRKMHIWSLNADIVFTSSYFELESVVFLVNGAENGTKAITITLHATAFARCQADTTEYTYNEQTYTGIIALAAAKNITIQSA